MDPQRVLKKGRATHYQHEKVGRCGKTGGSTQEKSKSKNVNPLTGGGRGRFAGTKPEKQKKGKKTKTHSSGGQKTAKRQRASRKGQKNGKSRGGERVPGSLGTVSRVATNSIPQ